MNYIWNPLIEAIQHGYDIRKIKYRLRDRKFVFDIGDDQVYYDAGAYQVSPLLEYLPKVVYDPNGTSSLEDKLSRVDVNPYHRFGFIFEHILRPGRNDPNDLVVCDILAHMLADVDRICGMYKRDFRMILIMEELERRFASGDGPGAYALFSVMEKRALAEILIMLYKTANSIRCLDALFGMIMTGFDVRIRDNREVVFYNPGWLDEQENKKLQFIIDLMLPIDFAYVIHWRHTYGSIGHDVSMVLGDFLLANCDLADFGLAA